MGETNKTTEFLSKFPMGKVPALECADGFCVAEGPAICQYLAAAGPKSAQLLGSDPKTQARIAEWVFLAETELVANFLPLALMSVLKMVPYDEARYGFHLACVERACGRVEVALAGGEKKYLVGEAITLADAMVAGVLIPLCRFFVDAEIRAKIPNTVAYLQSLAATKEFVDAYGAFEGCETRVKA